MKRIAIFITASIIYLSSCGPIDEWTGASVKKVPVNFYFDHKASSQVLNVDGGSSFTFSSNESWCVVGGHEDKGYFISVNANHSDSKRTATITIKYENEVIKTLSVDQQEYPIQRILGTFTAKGIS